MYLKAAPILSLLAVMVAVMVVEGYPTFAKQDYPALNVDQYDLAMSVVINQITLLKLLNESSSSHVSRESWLQELQMMKNNAISEIQDLYSNAENQLQEKINEAINEFQTVNTRTPAVVQEQPDSGRANTLHNDADPWLCGVDTVVYGSSGSLAPTRVPPYLDRTFCSWEVRLPEGTKPEFSWEYFGIEDCASCSCDYVRIWDPAVPTGDKLCGFAPSAHHSMYKIENNIFRVVFYSDEGSNDIGFRLKYRAISS
ncbi:cubilin-like isoform X2 [Portunus trituberculatus]|uniref:cubilin-like isoform X2 n=1 Tax=Portunus trituberculatus TaxID=210409 RepID=UPI001E1D195C|nr:cubilin-like isoform X2 [Portunus trituberculatus]